MLKYMLVRFGYLPVIGLLLYLWLLPSAAERQLKRTQVALQKATSWHMESQSTGPELDQSIVEDVVCPDTYRVATHMEVHVAGASNTDSETVVLPTVDYQRNNQGEWKRHEHIRTSSKNCPIPPPLLDSIREMLMTGKSEKGDKRLVDGESCRDWKWEIPRRFAPSEAMTLCISDGDDLPREIRSSAQGSVMRYSRWNQPITVLEPMMPSAQDTPPTSSNY